MPQTDSLLLNTAPTLWSYDVPIQPDSTVGWELCTVMIDSIAAEATVIEIPEGSHQGIAPELAPPHYSNSTSLTGLLMGVLVLVGLNAGGVTRALKSYRHDLWSVRRRPNVFDDERSVKAPVAILLALVFVVFGGIVGYNFPSRPEAPGFSGACVSMGVTGAFFLFHYIAYSATGYAFGTPSQRRRWVDGFLATMAYAGLLLVIPAFLLIYRPEWHGACVISSIIVYSLAKLLFIVKGVRIFFLNLGSLLYFILYLCTLEVIPALAYYRICVFLQGSIF